MSEKREKEVGKIAGTNSRTWETKVDFRLSWRMYRDNWKALVGAQLTGITVFFATIVGTFLLFDFFFFQDGSPAFEGSTPAEVILLVRILVVPALIVLYAFFGSLFGLSYEIMSGGDLFANYRETFRYFRRYWWRYVLLSMWLNLFGLLIPLVSVHVLGTIGPGRAEVSVELPVSGVFNFFWFAMFLLTFPSLTASGHLRESFRENWHLFWKNPSRVLLTYFTYFLVFELPNIIFALFFAHYYSGGTSAAPWVLVTFAIAVVVSSLYRLFVGYPMLSLLSTRVYNSLKLRETEALGDE
ncbi:MAG: hypothetical protein ACTSU5_04890 [Promethearchaeota archaeon]